MFLLQLQVSHLTSRALNVEDTVEAVIKKLLTDDLSAHVNWGASTRVNDKKILSKMKLRELIYRKMFIMSDFEISHLVTFV